MKKNFVITLAFLLQLSIQAQWVNQNPIPEGNSLRSVFFIDDHTGWIAGTDGLITKTTNSGETWIPQISNTTNTLKSIYFISSNEGWIAGENGKILYTNDGGIHWLSQNSGTPETLNSVHFLNNNIGWAAGENGKILLTTNGGTHWSSQTSGTSLSIFDITFVNSLNGYAVGGDGFFQELIIKTTDGGNSWIPAPSGGEGVLYSVAFIDANHGWAVGLDRKILSTTDGGNSWALQNLVKRSNPEKKLAIIDGMGGLRSVYFKDADYGWAVGGSNEYDRTIYSTTDGGATWNNKYYGLEEYDLFSVAVTPSGKSWAVGGGGSIFYSENGDAWSQQFSGTSLYNADDIYNINFLNDNVGFASGMRNDFITGSGLILKTTNGGNTWLTSFMDQHSGEPYKALFFSDSNTGWAANYSTQIRHTTDGGTTWSTQSLGADFSINSFLFTDSQTGFAAGEGIYKTTDAGDSWTEKFNGYINSVFFTDPLTGWAIGNTIVKTTDAGETWYEQSNTGGNSIYFINSLRGWAVGNGGTIRSTEDGGATWITQTSGITENLNSVQFPNALTGWASGEAGIILFTDNGGTSWNVQATGTTKTINSVYFSNQSNGWAGGNEGTLLKYYAVTPPFITIISPNGGEQLQGGEMSIIRWEDNIDENVRISLYKGEILVKTIAGNTKSDGYYEWKVKNLPAGSDYKIFIQSINDASVNDFSDSEFSITGKEKKFIILTAPMGGEEWHAGDIQQIKWVNNFSGNIEISLWRGNEEIFKISNSANNADSFSWTIPSGLETADNYFIRVTSLDQASLLDICDSSFRIVNGENVTELRKQKGIILSQNSLEQNFPNPFNPITIINYSIAESGFVTLKVYDITGKEITSLVNEDKPAGNYNVTFNGQNLASGVYFYILRNANFIETKKLLLIK